MFLVLRGSLYFLHRSPLFPCGAVFMSPSETDTQTTVLVSILVAPHRTLHDLPALVGEHFSRKPSKVLAHKRWESMLASEKQGALCLHALVYTSGLWKGHGLCSGDYVWCMLDSGQAQCLLCPTVRLAAKGRWEGLPISQLYKGRGCEEAGIIFILEPLVGGSHIIGLR